MSILAYIHTWKICQDTSQATHTTTAAVATDTLQISYYLNPKKPISENISWLQLQGNHDQSDPFTEKICVRTVDVFSVFLWKH